MPTEKQPSKRKTTKSKKIERTSSGRKDSSLPTASSTRTDLDPLSLWHVPDPSLERKGAMEEAARIVAWVVSGAPLDEEPDEEKLFCTLHACAYYAARRPRSKKITAKERMMWATRWEAVREYIVQINLGLVYSMIGRFSTAKLLDEDDLLSDAMLALTRAVDRFNPWRGYRFSTYACNVIARTLMRRGKRESNYRRLFPVQHDVSFERPSALPDHHTELYVERLQQALDKNLGDLTEVETHILAQRFPSERTAKLTFQEIGETIGLSKERVRQIQNIALGKLREVLQEDPVLQ